MTLTPLDDPRDRALALGAHGRLADLNRAGVLEAADVHVATRLIDLVAEPGERSENESRPGDLEAVSLAIALAVRAVRQGSVCLELAEVATDPALVDHPWPEADAWCAALEASPLVTPPGDGPRVLRLEGTRLYLDRYWREEGQVTRDLLARLDRPTSSGPDVPVTDTALDRVFPDEGYAEQRAAARVALAQPTTVLTGGPGTGKTTTVAALLALLAEQYAARGRTMRIALAAPTGKAAARLQQAVEQQVAALVDATDRDRLRDLRAVTLHRLLGNRPGSDTRFRHDRDNRLPHDVIVVDETSMVSLTMMARLLEAVRPTTRLILVGDPDQLTSVEAGAVLHDLVDGLGARGDHEVARLRTSHRFGAAILELAEAVRTGEPEAALEVLRRGDAHVQFLETPEAPDDEAAAAYRLSHSPELKALLLGHAEALWRAARDGDGPAALRALDDQRLLCAHREGPFGVRHWNDLVEQWLVEATGEPTWSSWYPGRPVLVTANDYGLGVYNGDVGVCVAGPTGLRAHVAATPQALDVAPGRLGDVDTMHAMTIHKSQGSQADTVVVLLPPPQSRLLTRQLLYTAITRAQEKVVVVGSAADVTAAVEREARRATGLASRLAPPTAAG